MCAVFAPGRVINFGSSRGETYHYDLGGYVGDPDNPWCHGTTSTNRLAAGGRGGGGGVVGCRGWRNRVVRSSPGILVRVGERRGEGVRARGAIHSPDAAHDSSSRCYCATKALRPAVCKLFRAVN